jgi:hypothetical protein
VHQLIVQNPTLFEFTGSLLVTLASEAFTGKYFEFGSEDSPSLFD